LSRFCGDKDSTEVLRAAIHWRDVALVGEGSIFGEKQLWVSRYLEPLLRYFVGRPDPGKRPFLVKLQEQLQPVEAAAKQLAAEMMWLMYLCPSSMTPRHKRGVIQTIWSWSGESLPETQIWLSDKVLGGLGSAGPGFNQNQWRELSFVINFLRIYRQLDREEASRLLGDPWVFADWLKNVTDWESRQFRHMLLFLLFPDSFERIFGQTDRKAVVRAFSRLEPREVAGLDPVEIDRQLSEIRQKLETEYDTTELDYYVPPLKDRWKQADFRTVTSTITSEHVRSALAEIDRDGAPASAQSTGYDLVEAGRRYPPKLVLAIAARFSTGQELDRSFFSGGIESQAFKVLQKLGFEIATKDLIGPLVTKFIDQARAGDDLKVQGYLDEYRGLKVRVSFGQGNFARIPWIAFLGKGQTVSDGVYPVLLLFREHNVLLLCYGISETNEPERSWESAPGDAKTVEVWFRTELNRSPERYGQSFVRSSYDLRKPLLLEALRKDLDDVIDQYEDLLGEPSASGSETESLPTRADLGEASHAFASALKEAHIDFGEAHSEIVASFLASIVAKPLVILTGLSGSGKTQIALRFGEWLGEGRLHVAAVRPDWTGAEALFGYEDGLKPAVEGRAAWVVTAPLEFMLMAASDITYPFLLLLDEMNLAHVERYFADVLSGMESGQPCLPNLVKGSDGIWRVRAQGPDRIPFPRNLWIVGTVNIDETTYMFSPKVLDRANTFEFRVGGRDLSVDVRKPVPCIPGDSALVRGLVALARDDAWQQANSATFQAGLGEKLRQLHLVLARYGMEFGHRVFYESLRFAALAEKAGLDSLEQVLDRVVMQKVLPRLHGARRRLELPLLALMHFARDLPDEVASDEKLSALQLDVNAIIGPRLPVSFDKLSRMLRNLRANQFASFTE
jgi:5-methylcytosine-specific restriction enzyme B